MHTLGGRGSGMKKTPSTMNPPYEDHSNVGYLDIFELLSRTQGWCLVKQCTIVLK